MSRREVAAVLVAAVASWLLLAHPLVLVGLALGGTVLAVVGAVIWDLICNAVDMPAVRDGRFDNASNPIRDESDHSRAKYRSHR